MNSVETVEMFQFAIISIILAVSVLGIFKFKEFVEKSERQETGSTDKENGAIDPQEQIREKDLRNVEVKHTISLTSALIVAILVWALLSIF